MAGAQDVRSRYCSLSRPRGPGSPRRPGRGDLGCPSVPASLEQPPALRLAPWHTSSGSPHTSKLALTGDAPTPASRVPGARPRLTQPRALPRRGPNKSLAFNYSSGLILMQLPGGGWRAGCWGGCGFYKPWEVGFGGAGPQGAGRWPRLVAGDASPPAPARLRLLSPGGGARRQMGSCRGGSDSPRRLCIIMTKSMQTLLSRGHSRHLQLHHLPDGSLTCCVWKMGPKITPFAGPR